MRCGFCGFETAGHIPLKCPGCGRDLKPISPFFRAIALVEDLAISFILVSMIVLVLVQIVMRNFYATGLSGGAEIVRHMLLWVAFLGAAIAAREGKHIRIDIAQRILPEGPNNILEIITGLFTTAVCSILLYASIVFIRNEYELGTTIPFFNMPVWVLELVIPLGYAAVTLRYLARSIQAAMRLARGD